MNAPVQALNPVAYEQEIYSVNGSKPEKEFAEFLKTKLGWQRIRTKANLPAEATAIDIIAERQNKKGKFFWGCGKIYITICTALIVIGLITGIHSDAGSILAGMGISLEIIGAVPLYAGLIMNQENGWVECKNLKSKVTINQIEKSLREYKNYISGGNKEYKFIKHYYFSASGFVENALKYALENGIICYEKHDGKFVRIQLGLSSN